MSTPRFLSHPLFVAFTIQLVLGYEWASAGWGKIHQGQFVPNIGKTLLRFGEGNPHNWYADTLLQVAVDHPMVFGMLVQWGEFLAGVGLIGTIALYAFSKQPAPKNAARILAIAALCAGAFMNLNFYFAAGWTSSSTGGFNALMFWIQIALLLGWIALPGKGQKDTDKRAR